MASTAAASLRLVFPILSAPVSSSSSSSNSLRFPLRRRCAVTAFKKLSEASPVPIPQEPTQPLVDEDTLPPKPGVYGVYDPAGELQFVGISRNGRASVEGHRRKVPANLCASVKVAVSDEETPDRAALNNAWKSWMEEHIEATGKAPPGNVAGNYTWVGAPPEASRPAVDTRTPCPADRSTRTVDRPVGEGEQSGSLHQRIKECSPVWILTKGGGYLGSTWSGFRNC